MASTRRKAAFLAALALCLAPVACGSLGLSPREPPAVPRAVLDDPPPFDILPPGRDVPPDIAGFSGVWIAGAVDGVPAAANARTILAVTYVGSGGDVLLERAETRNDGFFSLGWRWDVTSRRARVERGALVLGAGRWLTPVATSPPTLREHVWSKAREADVPGLLFARMPP